MTRDDRLDPEKMTAPRATPNRGQPSAVVSGLLRRMHLPTLTNRYDPTAVTAIFSFLNGCLSIAIMAVLALITDEPFIFPSLGPTAFLFFYTPLAPVASPRNAIYGHLIGVGAGWSMLALFGLRDDGPAIATGVSNGRVMAAALSLGLTAGLMVLFRAPHPPAGATTLIISLGIMRTFEQLAILMVAVVLLTVQAFIINRLAGLPYPLWATPTPASTPAGKEAST